MWSAGDKCMAPFSEDDKYYRATIQSIVTDCQGNQRAKVKFSGYTSDENETMDLTRLKERVIRRRQHSGSVRPVSTTSASSGSNTSFTSPLRYMPEQDRLRDKFSDLLDDESANKRILTTPKSSCGSSTLSTSKSSQKRKYAVATGGEIKEASPVNGGSRTTSKSSSIQTAPTTSDDQSYLDDITSLEGIEGFSSAELERPYFPESSHVGPKVPFLLSEPDTEPVVQVPATINRYLRDYQREGVRFLYQHFIKNQGAILGDDMGLGKTVQVLAFLCAVLGKTGTKEDCQRRLPEFMQKKLKSKKPGSTDVYLIISPNAVLYNWLDEFETWTYCTTGKYHGKEREETLLRASRGKLDVVLTTYETFRIYLDEMCTVKWKAVFVDEVHKIKSPMAKVTEALKSIETDRRYGLTGTALQNDMTELWCLLDWANPGCFGSLHDFKYKFASRISKGQKFDASKRELAEGRQTSLKFARLRSKWLLRRTKAIIAHQLPTKEEKVVFCKLTDLQLSVYKALIDSDDLQQLVLRQYEKCDCGSDWQRGRCCYEFKMINDKKIKVKSLTFSFMHLLTKVSNHVALLMPETKMSDLQRYTVQTYCDIAFAKHPQFVQLSRNSRFCTLSDPKYCGKMQVLEKLLQVFRRENSKVLIFSHYTQLLDIFEMYLKTTDYVYRRLDGKTPAQDRLKYAHEFNRDKDIFLFLISTKAGGVGLNLTGANVVIIYDPTWNPTYDLQAQDRAYRIGQHRDVRVYRLISAGSIEENMYLRQIYKQQIASVAIESENAKRYFTGVAGSKDKSGELFGLRNMFALRSGDCVLTKDVIERESKTIAGITMAKYIPHASVNEIDNSNQKQPSDENDDEDKDEDDNDIDNGIQDNDDDDEDNPASIKSDDDDDDNDVHGIASQLMISDESDEEQNIHDLERSSTKDSSSRGVAGSKQQKKRGKAILHKDGRIERRSKRTLGHKSDVGHGDQLDTDSSSDEEDLAQRRGGKQKSKIDTVDDVLKECGIKYVHSNHRLVGGSKVEDHVSNAAIHDVFELDQHSQEPANFNVPTLADDVDSQNSTNSKDKALPSVYHSHNLPTSQSKPVSDKLNKTTILIGQTPKGIRKRHFEELAKSRGISITDLAKQILQASLEEQVNMLKDHYTEKHTGLELATYFELTDEPESKMQRSQRRGRPPKQPVKKLSQQRDAVKGTASRGEKTTQRKVTQTERRTRRQQEKRRSKSRGFDFESASESEDSEESGDESSRIQKTESSRIKKPEISRIQKGKMSRTQKGDDKTDLSLINDVEEMDADGARTNSPAPSDVEEMDTNDSDESGGGGEDRLNGKEFTNLRGEGSHVQEDNSSEKRQGCSATGSRVSDDKTDAQEQNLSFLDDIFLDEPSSKKVRKPPPKKSSHHKPPPSKKSSQKDHPVGDLWGDDLNDHVEDTSANTKTIPKPPPRTRRYPARQSLQKHPVDDLLREDLEKDSTEDETSAPESEDVQDVRKPLPKTCKRKSPYRSSPRKSSRRNHLLDDLQEDDLTDSVKDSEEISLSGTEIDTEPDSKLWRKNSKYGLKLEEIDASLEEESQSVFNKYSSSFVTNKNFKRKLYQFDAEKGEIFSESLSSA